MNDIFYKPKHKTNSFTSSDNNNVFSSVSLESSQASSLFTTTTPRKIKKKNKIDDISDFNHMDNKLGDIERDILGINFINKIETNQIGSGKKKNNKSSYKDIPINLSESSTTDISSYDYNITPYNYREYGPEDDNITSMSTESTSYSPQSNYSSDPSSSPTNSSEDSSEPVKK